MKSFISSLDILSYHPTVYFNGRTYYQTLLGGIITLFTFIAIITCSIILLIEYINGSNKNIIFSREANFNSEFNLNDVFFGYTLFSNTNEVVPESILSVTGIRVKEIDSLNLNFTIFSVNPCTEKNIPNLKYNNLDIEYFKMFKCLNFSNTNIGGNKKNYFNLYIHKCNNETYNNKCKSMNEIDEFIKTHNIYILLYYQYVVVDHSNKNTPLTFNTIVKDITIPNGLGLIAKTYFRKTIYETDSNHIFKNRHLVEAVSPEFSSMSYTYSTNISTSMIPNLISVFMFDSADDYAEKYTRTYEKIGVLFGNIGGIINILYYFAIFITSLLTKGFYFNDLITLSNFNNFDKIDYASNYNKNDNSNSNIIINLKTVADSKPRRSIFKSINNSNYNKTLQQQSILKKNNYFNKSISKSVVYKHNNLHIFKNEYDINNISLRYILFYSFFIFKCKKYKQINLFHLFVKSNQKKLSCNNIIMKINLLNQINSYLNWKDNHNDIK